MTAIEALEKMENEKPVFDGFDCNGKPTGNKCILCPVGFFIIYFSNSDNIQ